MVTLVRDKAKVAAIKNRYGREPNAYELLALQQLPLQNPDQLYDTSPTGREIYELLKNAADPVNPDISKLQEAGELLFRQRSIVPPPHQHPRDFVPSPPRAPYQPPTNMAPAERTMSNSDTVTNARTKSRSSPAPDRAKSSVEKVAPSAPKQTTHKRRRCLRCQTTHKQCDKERPCARCIITNKECIYEHDESDDESSGPRDRKVLAKNSFNNPDIQQTPAPQSSSKYGNNGSSSNTTSNGSIPFPKSLSLFITHPTGQPSQNNATNYSARSHNTTENLKKRKATTNPDDGEYEEKRQKTLEKTAGVTPRRSSRPKTGILLQSLTMDSMDAEEEGDATLETRPRNNQQMRKSSGLQKSQSGREVLSPTPESQPVAIQQFSSQPVQDEESEDDHDKVEQYLNKRVDIPGLEDLHLNWNLEARAIQARLQTYKPAPVVEPPAQIPLQRQYAKARLYDCLREATNGFKDKIFKVNEEAWYDDREARHLARGVH